MARTSKGGYRPKQKQGKPRKRLRAAVNIGGFMMVLARDTQRRPTEDLGAGLSRILSRGLDTPVVYTVA